MWTVFGLADVFEEQNGWFFGDFFAFIGVDDLLQLPT